MILVDTSALYALLDRDDHNHPAAKELWEVLLERGEPLCAHTYVGVETAALVQRRLGMEAVRALEALMGVITLYPVSLALHQQALAALLSAGRREISLVDWVSFLWMREQNIRQAFAFDQHFLEQGFNSPPSKTP